MPRTSVAVPYSGTPRPSVSTETTETLAKRVDANGLCSPAMTGLRVTAESDPWFPTIESGDQAIQLAREACQGCPVKAECLELALRQERAVGDVWGVRGGLAAGERRLIIRSHRLVSSVQVSQ